MNCVLTADAEAKPLSLPTIAPAEFPCADEASTLPVPVAAADDDDDLGGDDEDAPAWEPHPLTPDAPAEPDEFDEDEFDDDFDDDFDDEGDDFEDEFERELNSDGTAETPDDGDDDGDDDDEFDD